MRVLGIIPARGGSKGIPRKNIRLLAGKPLLQYTVESTINSKHISKILLSTDDPEIASIGEAMGLWVPFLRPKELAKDDTPTLTVVLSILNWLEEIHLSFDAYCLLQPTSPFRTSIDIDNAIELLINSNADSVVSVTKVPLHFNPDWQLIIDTDNILHTWTNKPLSSIPTSRQQLRTTFIRNGAIYITRHSTLVNQKSLYGKVTIAYDMTSTPHVNIDTEDDWIIAEKILLKADKK
jgi:CMP-N-acetylneuraminic acid synthetase